MDRAKLFVVCSLIMIIGSVSKLCAIGKTEERVRQWQSFVDTRYKFTGGYYQVDTPPSDGPSQMDIAWSSYRAKDYKTAREYAEKALGQGVGEAASLLIDIYYYGLGVEPDLHQSVKYLLTGMEASFVDWSDDFIVLLEDSGYVFTERERMLLEKRQEDNDFLLKVVKEIEAAFHSPRKDISKILKKYHSRMEDMSFSGSATATFFLYMESIEEQWQRGTWTSESFERCRKYCDILMSADCLPTDPYSRAQACVIHDGRQDYKASNVDYYIKHNVYPELCPENGLRETYHENLLLNDVSADEYLFAKYRLYRAQYEYLKSFLTSFRRRNIIMCYQYDADYSIMSDFVKSRKLLEDVILDLILAMGEHGDTEHVEAT